MIRIVLIFVAFIFVTISHADEHMRTVAQLTDLTEKCDASKTALEYNMCFSSYAESIATKLHDTYSTLKERTVGNDTQRLVDAQTAWLDYRTTECKFYNPIEFNSNTYYAAQQIRCETSLNLERIKTLDVYLSWTGCGSCR